MSSEHRAEYTKDNIDIYLKEVALKKVYTAAAAIDLQKHEDFLYWT